MRAGAVHGYGYKLSLHAGSVERLIGALPCDASRGLEQERSRFSFVLCTQHKRDDLRSSHRFDVGETLYDRDSGGRLRTGRALRDGEWSSEQLYLLMLERSGLSGRRSMQRAKRETLLRRSFALSYRRWLRPRRRHQPASAESKPATAIGRSNARSPP